MLKKKKEKNISTSKATNEDSDNQTISTLTPNASINPVNRQLTDTTNQQKKTVCLPLYDQNTSFQNRSGEIEVGSTSGNLLIINDIEPTIQLITRDISDISEFKSAHRHKQVSSPTGLKLPSNILLKLVDILRKPAHNTLSLTNSLMPATIQMIPKNINPSSFDQDIAKSPHSEILIKSTIATASDADDEIDDIDNEDTDETDYQSDTNSNLNHKLRELLNVQNRDFCLTNVEKKAMTDQCRIFPTKTKKFRHLKQLSGITSPVGLGQKSSRSNSIDQLIAAAAVTSVRSPTPIPLQAVESVSASSSSGECQIISRKNLNTIVEAIKHVEGFTENITSVEPNSVASSADENPTTSTTASASNASGNTKNQHEFESQTLKPPKKRKYAADDRSQMLVYFSDIDAHSDS